VHQAVGGNSYNYLIKTPVFLGKQGFYMFSELHGNIPCLPDDAAQVANLAAVANMVDTAASGELGTGAVAHGQND
jgi:hypothetical protein